MSSIRQQIVTALQARLATILVAGGYGSNVGVNVFVWRKAPLLESELPCLHVADRKMQRFPAKVLSQVRNLLTCEVLGVMVGQDDAAARIIEEDVIKCLGGSESAGGLADQVLVTASEIGAEQHGQFICSLLVTVEIEYYTAGNKC